MCFPDKEPQMLEVSLFLFSLLPHSRPEDEYKQQEKDRIQAGRRFARENCHGNAATTRGQVLTFVLITNPGMNLNSPWPTILSKFCSQFTAAQLRAEGGWSKSCFSPFQGWLLPWATQGGDLSLVVVPKTHPWVQKMSSKVANPSKFSCI